MLVLVLSLLSLLLPLENTHAQEIDNAKPKILILGDSLSAAYGIQIEQGWVALLQAKLIDSHHVINASISGETTDGGLRAISTLLNTHAPGVVIIELGANDGLRGFPLPVIQRNLTELVRQSKKAGARTLLIGNHIPPNYGKAYSSAFFALFSQVATEEGVALVPFMLDQIAIKPELMQDDGLHPLAEAQATILDNIWPVLSPLL